MQARGAAESGTYPQSDLSSARPAYAVLDNFILRIIDVYEMPGWKDSLEEFMKENGRAKMSAKKEKNVKEKKKISLTSMIFIALIAGAITGMVLHYLVPDSSVKNDVIVEGVLYVLGQGFIRLMKMLVVPLVFCSLVCGSMAIGDTKKLGNVGGKTLAFYLVTTAVAVAVALGIGTLLRPGIGLDMSKIQVNASDIETMESTSLVQTILNIIPDNPIKSLASGEMLQIIVFALIIGVILAKLGERAETVSNFISQFNDIMMEMTMMVMSLAPIGVFSLIARTFATIGFSAFVPLAKYMIAVLIALAIQCFGVYQILLETVHRPESGEVYQKVFPGYGLCLFHCNLQCDYSAFY